MKFRQAYLENENARIVCWIDTNNWDVKKGSIITLKEIPNAKLEVIVLYEMEVENEKVYKPWRVGGLE